MTPEEIGSIVAGVQTATKNSNKKDDTTSLFVKATKSDVTVGFFNIFTKADAEITAVINALAKAGLTASIYDPNARTESPGFGL